METLSAKVPADLMDTVQKVKEEHNLTRSEAVRRLLRKGIEREKREAKHESGSVGLKIFAALCGFLGIIGVTIQNLSINIQVEHGFALLLLALVFGVAGSYIGTPTDL